MRIEAAAMRGRPVFFSVVEEWTQPDRAAQKATSAKDVVTFLVLSLTLVAVCLGSALVARHNLKQNRGDRRGALRLAFFFACLQMSLWLVRGHFTASAGTFGAFLLALCTSVFYSVVIWTVYLALEPAVVQTGHAIAPEKERHPGRECQLRDPGCMADREEGDQQDASRFLR